MDTLESLRRFVWFENRPGFLRWATGPAGWLGNHRWAVFQDVDATWGPRGLIKLAQVWVQPGEYKPTGGAFYGPTAEDAIAQAIGAAELTATETILREFRRRPDATGREATDRVRMIFLKLPLA